jgi:choline dehydrogenase-like flavoprotein
MSHDGDETRGHCYDVIVVGGGIMGCVLAKVLAELAYKEQKSISILILEAGTGGSSAEATHQAYLDTYYGALTKTPNSPYPSSIDAPSPEDLAFLKAPQDRYFVQEGKIPFGSNNLRILGGTTHHWMGIALRMLRTDFELRTRYDRGMDWPFTYCSLKEYYEEAEWEIGVAANREDQLKIYGVSDTDFGKYRYPMKALPVSFLDRELSRAIGADYKFKIGEKEYPVRLVPIPQGRNSIPDEDKDAHDPRGYVDPSRINQPYLPVGAPENPLTGPGQRCEGNASCIPICPSRAKYTALKTVRQLHDLSKLPGIRVDIITKAVASDLQADVSGNIVCVNYLQYEDPELSYAVPHRTVGRRFVLAGSAIENAKLLLASRNDSFQKGLANRSDCVGRHLMDHPFVLAWGLMPEGKPVGAFRGPGVTSDLPMRDGEFRREQAAFRTDVGNWGWALTDSAPARDVERLIDPDSFRTGAQGEPQTRLVPKKPVFGEELRSILKSRIQRQITLGFLLEQLPEWDNRVSISDRYRDPLGLHRPVIHYDISDYTGAGMSTAYNLATTLLREIGATDYTDHENGLGTPIQFGNQKFKFIGAGHIMGTHRMGGKAEDSVVNEYQQSWDHLNLYIVGCGSMPTVGTSNPTLTGVALTIKSAKHMFRGLDLGAK